jgi:hypothetical protein
MHDVLLLFIFFIVANVEFRGHLWKIGFDNSYNCVKNCTESCNKCCYSNVIILPFFFFFINGVYNCSVMSLHIYQPNFPKTNRPQTRFVLYKDSWT